MLSIHHIFDTIDMIDKRHLDIRTITMGISLLDCVSEDPKRCCEKIYDKICRRAQHLVRTGEEIQGEFGIPIVNKRISVTPMALVAGGCDTEDYVPFAHAMDRAAKTCGVDFIGGYSALVQKGFACGVWTSYFVLRALAGRGRYEEVYHLLVNESEHGWMNMLREGATTCFEAWGKEQKWNIK